MEEQETYLLVSNKYPYQSYAVATKKYCEEKLKLKKYQKGYHIRKALDNSDGCYRIVTKGGGVGCIGYLTFKRALSEQLKNGNSIQFAGTERDWEKMRKQDVCIQDSIRGFGRDISQKWSKELYKTEL